MQVRDTASLYERDADTGGVRIMNKIIEKLKETARKYPDRTAFADPSASVSFAKLQDMTDRIATLLLRGSVCTPFRTGTPAAFYMEKNTPAVCALFGVIRAGGFCRERRREHF